MPETFFCDYYTGNFQQGSYKMLPIFRTREILCINGS
jgi:hypothetical protein